MCGRFRVVKAIAGFGLLGAVVLPSGTASACAAMPALSAPINAVPSTEVTTNVSITAEQVVAGTPLAIHWNSPEGATLATVSPGTGETTAVKLKVPDVAPGVYYLVLTSNEKGRVATQAMEVAGPGSPQVATFSGSARRNNLDALTSHPTPPFAPGVAMLAVGLTALAGAVVVTAVRRPKAAAVSGTGTDRFAG